MKKTLALILALVMVFALAACGQQAAAPAAAPAEAKTYKVGVAIYQFDDNFMTLYRNELQDYFKTLETDSVKYDVTVVDGKNDMAEQNNQIDNFITQGMDAIILNLVQTSSAEAAIDKIVAAGIPCILINREPLGDKGDESYAGILNNATVCYVGADARQSGTFQGEIIRDLPNHGDINGDGKVSYIMIEGDPENVDAQYRTEFSVKALKDAGIEVECLDDQIGNWAQAKGQEICANDLSQFGDKIEVVFCNNDGMALGAFAAITAAGRTVGKDIYLVGVDALPECVEMINEGTMTGTVLNDHVGQSHAAVDVTVKALKGEPIDNYYWVDYVKVTNDAAAAAEPAAPAELVKVGIINLDPSESGYRQANVKDLTDTFTKANGYDATFVTAPTADKQLEAAKGFITAEVKYILVSAAETTGWDEVLEEAQEAGIKVFLFDRMIDCDPSLYTAAVVSDMRQEGETAVAWLESLGLDEYKILHIQGQLGSAAQIGRSDPLTEKCAADAKWTIVREGTGGDSWDPNEARKIDEGAIDAGESFNIVYAENDGMADGVVQALDAKGITHGVDGDVIVMGFDCNKWALEKLLAGEWNYDGQCSPFQAGVIDQMIKTLEAGGQIEGLNALNQIISVEKGFDARTITQADINTYGLG